MSTIRHLDTTYGLLSAILTLPQRMRGAVEGSLSSSILTGETASGIMTI